jgi:hypothetical protein
LVAVDEQDALTETKATCLAGETGCCDINTVIGSVVDRDHADERLHLLGRHVGTGLVALALHGNRAAVLVSTPNVHPPIVRPAHATDVVVAENREQLDRGLLELPPIKLQKVAD